MRGVFNEDLRTNGVRPVDLMRELGTSVSENRTRFDLALGVFDTTPVSSLTGDAAMALHLLFVLRCAMGRSTVERKLTEVSVEDILFVSSQQVYSRMSTSRVSGQALLVLLLLLLLCDVIGRAFEDAAQQRS